MAGTITVAGASLGESAGSRIFGPLTIVGRAVVEETLKLSLSIGDNTVTIPTGAIAAIILPPGKGEGTIKVRSSLNSGDGGLPINPEGSPFVYVFPATPPTTLIVNASATVAGFTIIFI